jgi:hypothetical protein
MNTSDLRADLIDAINEADMPHMMALESADNENVILLADCHGNRYRLIIGKIY